MVLEGNLHRGVPMTHTDYVAKKKLGVKGLQAAWAVHGKRQRACTAQLAYDTRGSHNPQFYLHHMIHMGHRNTPVKVSLEYHFILFDPIPLNCENSRKFIKNGRNLLGA